MHLSISTPRLERLIACFAALGSFSEVLFVLAFAGVSVAVSVALGYTLGQLGIHQDERTELLRYGMPGFFLMVVVFGPAIETLLLQQLPIVAARRFGMPVAFQFALGSVPFAATHFRAGIVAGVAAGVVGGVVFSLAYLTFISQSKTKAFWLTTAIHSLHNLVAGLLYTRDLPNGSL